MSYVSTLVPSQQKRKLLDQEIGGAVEERVTSGFRLERQQGEPKYHSDDRALPGHLSSTIRHTNS